MTMETKDFRVERIRKSFRDCKRAATIYEDRSKYFLWGSILSLMLSIIIGYIFGYFLFLIVFPFSLCLFVISRSMLGYKLIYLAVLEEQK